MQKTQIRKVVLRVVKTKVDIERNRDKSKKRGGILTVAKTIDEYFNRFLDSARSYLGFVCVWILAHSA